MGESVQLSNDLFISEGTDRKCFRHPGDARLCIKVLHPERRSGRFWREIRYFRRLQQRGADLTHLSAFRGLLETSIGQGAVFELVQDDDQRVSRSLHSYLAENNPDFNRWAIEAIEDLKQNLLHQWIVFHDLNPTNILAQRLSYDEYRLVVIDGIGHNHFFPLASYSRKHARDKLVRVWNRRYLQWYQAFPQVVNRLKPYPHPV
ncbi:MAG: YrbL family protein [Pseudomonadota bacterium]